MWGPSVGILNISAVAQLANDCPQKGSLGWPRACRKQQPLSEVNPRRRRTEASAERLIELRGAIYQDPMRESREDFEDSSRSFDAILTRQPYCKAKVKRRRWHNVV